MSLVSTGSISEYTCISGQPAYHPSRPDFGLTFYSPLNNDPGIWTSGNAWEAAGMTRVLATVSRSPLFYDGRHDATNLKYATPNLVNAIREIPDTSMRVLDPAGGGLLRNYLDYPT